MHASPAEWLILPSRQQRWLDTGLALSLLILFLVSLSGYWSLLALVPAILLVAVLVCKTKTVTLGVDQDGWWIQCDSNERQRVSWASGSIRRSRMLVLIWGFWPWQVIRIRGDSFQNPEQFRHLKYCLYGSI
ncbi:MAG: hypothetical protein VW258_05150 [Thalassolituus sp.]